MSAIEKEKRWKHKPIGPLGSLLTLTDQKWGRAVEACLVGCAWSYPLFLVSSVLQSPPTIGLRVAQRTRSFPSGQ
jgi:hypothetical protein